MLKSKFWKSVEIPPDSSSIYTHWLWRGNLDSKGYGHFGTISAHRMAWILQFGPLFTKQFVCHTCVRKDCVRPRHLFLSDNRGNQRDELLKFGSYIAKLKKEDILDIRKLRKEGRTTVSLGIQFGVNPGTITRITNGKYWGWL